MSHYMAFALTMNTHDSSIFFKTVNASSSISFSHQNSILTKLLKFYREVCTVKWKHLIQPQMVGGLLSQGSDQYAQLISINGVNIVSKAIS